MALELCNLNRESVERYVKEEKWYTYSSLARSQMMEEMKKQVQDRSVEILQILLADSRVDPWYLTEIVKLLLSDARVDPTARNYEALANAKTSKRRFHLFSSHVLPETEQSPSATQRSPRENTTPEVFVHESAHSTPCA
ncbi:hypothetical protein PROFUN_04547 [Planoprotostelium fungivorum]|uniref:Uncharacterized protein n=1 Tax=Planoprotostelium fungivorum TaxID=1890364 RepID=A0A2P6NBI0_9EUKA|nr:hypothetical protein PROFUN_04547 [Planoprotostelium fungivorum]